MKHERRTVPLGEVRVPDGDGRTFEAVVLNYGVVDDYGTRFRPGCFAQSLEERMPRICWAHRWDEPLGRYTSFRDTDTELTLVGEFDDFDAVPRARQAMAQLRSGTIDQFSVGFMRLADEVVDPDEVEGRTGIVDITRGQLDEASLVLVGAVPGTKLLTVRSSEGATLMVDPDTVVDLARQINAGEITFEEAQTALTLAAGGTVAEPESEVDPVDVDEALAEVAEALDELDV